LMELINKLWVPAFLEYDVACRFYMYLKNYEPELLSAVENLYGPGMTPAKGATVIAGIKLALGMCFFLLISRTRLLVCLSCCISQVGSMRGHTRPLVKWSGPWRTSKGVAWSPTGRIWSACGG
jgi:hypothetical protein